MLGYFLVFLVSFFLGRLTMTSMNTEQVLLKWSTDCWGYRIVPIGEKIEPLKKYFLGIHVRGDDLRKID